MGPRCMRAPSARLKSRLSQLESYKTYPPLQAPEAYNLDGIIAEMKASRTASHSIMTASGTTRTSGGVRLEKRSKPDIEPTSPNGRV
jgi:hypothetical protein